MLMFPKLKPLIAQPINAFIGLETHVGSIYKFWFVSSCKTGKVKSMLSIGVEAREILRLFQFGGLRLSIGVGPMTT
jgi:hypothetical protein